MGASFYRMHPFVFCKMSLIIRKIQQEDNVTVANIIRISLEEYGIAMPGTVYTDPTTDHLYELFQKEGSEYDVALYNGVIAGCCGIYPTVGLPEGCVELVKFYVSGSLRGKGIGVQLMNKSIESAKRLGYKQLYIETFSELSQAVSLYQKTGFKMLLHALGNSGHFACTIWMLKDL
jgi:putative acetyltransferase